MALCVTFCFRYKNPDTSKKARQFFFRFFIYKNPDTLRYAIFQGNFEIGEGGRHFFNAKNNALGAKCLYQKKSVMFLCRKSRILC